MYAATKRRTYFQLGLFIGVIGVLLALVGLYYTNSNAYGMATQRAVTLWGGILLTCFALRNVTLAYPATRFTMDSMWDTCSAVFNNLVSFLISGTIIGITLWAHIDFFKNADIDNLEDSNELVNLVAILLLGTLSMLACLVGCIIACFPITDTQAPLAGEQFAMDNQAFSKQ